MAVRDSKERSETSSARSSASFKSKGLSWVRPGSMTIFSKDTSFPSDGVVDSDNDNHTGDGDDRDEVSGGDEDDDGEGVSEKEDDTPDEE